MKHSDAIAKVRLAITELGGISVPYTVGMFRTMDGERVVKVGIDGVSDVLACISGRFVGVEVKVGRDQHRDNQKSFKAAVERAGGVHVLARFTDKEDGVKTLNEAIACL